MPRSVGIVWLCLIKMNRYCNVCNALVGRKMQAGRQERKQYFLRVMII